MPEQVIVSLAEIAEPANGICWPWPWERAAEAENGARYSRGSSRSTRTRHSPRADATSLARCGPPPTPTELPDLDGRHTDPLSRRRPRRRLSEACMREAMAETQFCAFTCRRTAFCWRNLIRRTSTTRRFGWGYGGDTASGNVSTPQRKPYKILAAATSWTPQTRLD